MHSSRVLQISKEILMKLYDSIGPNPRVVRMFMAEKSIKIPTQTVDLMKGSIDKVADLAVAWLGSSTRCCC